MANLFTRFRALGREELGQDLIEYALLASLIAVVAMVAVGDAGTEVGRLWANIVEGIPEIP